MTDAQDPTLQDATLLRFAKAALAAGEDPQELSWEDLDLSDPEQRRFGDYELLELLGRGGMGVVYRARQERLDREVAIKFIASNVADDPGMIAKFHAEAQAAARLHHPHIVPVFEVGSVDCLHYFTMPLLRGKTLADVGRLP
ncbi:MAG: protein kinase, partial [Xanthomonadales bacterium]|nr:protein kinase [Xanthomonadales bacterium]